jgi:hypothetical protein
MQASMERTSADVNKADAVITRICSSDANGLMWMKKIEWAEERRR